MISASVSIDISKMGKVTPQTTNALAGGLYREGQSLRTESMQQAPVFTGFMRSTAYVTHPEIAGNYISVEVGYTAEYARHVHERLDLTHDVGNAKFLENPMNARIPRFTANVAKDIIPTLTRL